MAKEYGLLRFVSNEEIDANEKGSFEIGENEEAISSLASSISKAWEVNRQTKEFIEEELLRCLRQVKGEYDPEILAQIREMGGSEIYMMLTATKKRAGAAWMREIVLPDADRPWGLDPTPIPELPSWAQDEIANRIGQTLQPEDTEDVIMSRVATMRDEVLKSLREIADDAAGRMEEVIADQLVEGEWERTMSEFVDDFTTFPVAIVKGPIIRKRKTMKWPEMGSREMKPIIEEELKTEHYRVSPFDAYPSPDATDINDGNFIERIRFTRSDLFNMKGLKGYKDKDIDAALEEYGRTGLRDWLWRDYERAHLEDKNYWWLRSEPGTIDGLHYWGKAQGVSLLEWGISPSKVKEPLAEYEIDAIKVGNHIIRCVINKDPLQKRPYHKTSFQKVPGSWWGLSIPFLMRDIQRMCNATARALANNLGIASGPQVEVNIDRMASGEPIEAMHPWKYWQTLNDPTGSSQPAIRFFQPSSNAAELLKVYEEFEKRADDATNIPRYSYGSDKVGGAGRTASGLAMLLGNAAKGIKLAISNIDTDVTKTTITALFVHNMLHHEDPMIKGDVKIRARGANAILIKEQAQLRHTELLGMTANEFDMGILGKLGRAALLREIFKVNNLPDLIPSDDEMMDEMRKAQEQGPPPNPDEMKLKQKADHDTKSLAQDHAHHQEDMAVERERTDAMGAADVQKNRDRLAMEERIKVREQDMLDVRDARRHKRDRANDEMAHSRDMAQIREKIHADIELKKNAQKGEDKNSGEKSESTQPQSLTVIVDAAPGSAKKHIKLNRKGGFTPPGAIESGDVTYIPEEGQK